MSLRGIIKKLDFAINMIMRARKNLPIHLSDGTILRADVFTPLGKGPWPVILTTFPYQKDGMGGGMAMLEGYDLIKAGYAVVVADLRGYGASGGIAEGPFDGLRKGDLYELVEWCSSQRWSNGKVGMKGESYGGMSALLAASAKPPSLQAIYVFMAPAFFYKNLVYPGGTLNMIGLCGAWLGFMNITNLFPPFYIKNLPEWRELWKKRLDHYIPYLISASEHVLYDEYWKGFDLPVKDIEIPTFILEGWWDFARDDAFQIFEDVRGPKKLLVGPWVHTFPSFSELEQMDYMHNMIRWFDYWLKGDDNGIMDEPPFSIFVMGQEHWKYENEWPPERANENRYYLHGNGLLAPEADYAEATLRYEHKPEVGTTSGLMLVFPLGLDYPGEQSKDNERSLVFDTPELDDWLEITGVPYVKLTVSTDMPDAAITVKLCDVNPDGKSNLITTGSLRLSFSQDYENPIPPEPGKVNEVKIRLFNTDYKIAPGHRLRLCISLSDFPRIFPLPYRGIIELHFGKLMVQELVLPAVKGEKQPKKFPKFKLPDLSLIEGQKEPETFLKVKDDSDTGRITVKGGFAHKIPLVHLKSPLDLSYSYNASIMTGDPSSAQLETEGKGEFLLDGHNFKCYTRQIVKHWKVEVTTEIKEDDKKIFDKTFKKNLQWATPREA